MNRSWNFRRGVLLALAGYTAFLVFAAPQRCCADALQAGLRLCGGPLLVSLFPFLIVSALAAGCGAGQWLGFVFRPAARLMGIRAKGAGGVLLIGALGGFAPAAVAASEAVRTGQLTSRQASALLPACVQRAVLCHPHGRAADAGQPRGGVRLFAAQLLAGYLTAALLCRMQGGAGQAPPAQGETIQLPALDAVIAQAAVTYLKLCGFVLYFRLLAAGVRALLPQPWAALPAMLLEVCSGCDQAARTGLWASTLCCAALSVQGCRCFCRCAPSARPRSRCGLCWQRGRCICRFRWRCSGWAAPCRCRPCRPYHPDRTGGGAAPRPAGLRPAGLCRVLHHGGGAGEELRCGLGCGLGVSPANVREVGPRA